MNELISSLAPIRTVLDSSGFTFVDHITPEQSAELERLGYNQYYFAPYDEYRGEVVIRAVASAPSKTYHDAQDWIWEVLDLDAKAEAFKKENDRVIRQEKVRDLYVDVPESYSFDRTNDNFTDNIEHDGFFIVVYQNIFNDRLKAHGYVFLNEVLRALGFERNQAGQLMGWKEGDKIVIETLHEDHAIILKFPTAHYIFDVLKEN